MKKKKKMMMIFYYYYCCCYDEDAEDANPQGGDEWDSLAPRNNALCMSPSRGYPSIVNDRNYYI